jgi:tetratricopeptide (TPR) repeat protein
MTGTLRAPQAALFVVVLAGVAFLNSFGGQFVFDDIHEIARNPRLEPLIPPWQAMFVGNKLPARPLPYLSFAIDRALWGIQPFGYHLTNLVIHAIAAVALFDLVRLALASPRLGGRWADRAVPLAMVIATIWAVHPLQTQAVTYIYQRIESLTGMLCLVALAAFAESAVRGWPRGWLLGSAAAAAAAMASKENAVVLPLLILVYDWLFVPAEPGPDTSPNWARNIRGRGWYYLLLGATWVILAGMLLIQAARYQEFEELQHSPREYLYTQSEVILHYLRLAILPVGQRFDYAGWPVATSLVEVWPAFLVVTVLVVVTAVGTMLRRPWAAIGVLFFLSLAPTSSILPVEAVANEHRMYVALAAVVAAVVLAAMAAFDRSGSRAATVPAAGDSGTRGHRAAVIVAGAVILALVIATQFRNQLYASPTTLWMDVLKKDRDNFRAYHMMASALDAEGDPEFATEMAKEAVRRRSKSKVFSELARHHMAQGNPAMAEYYLRQGYDLMHQLYPPHDKAVQIITSDLATVLREQRKTDEVRRLCEEVLGSGADGHAIYPKAEIAAALLLAECAKNDGDFAQAELLTARAMTLAAKPSEPGDTSLLNAACLRADVLLGLGRAADARGLLEERVRALRAQSRRTQEDQHFLDLFLRMLRDFPAR